MNFNESMNYDIKWFLLMQLKEMFLFRTCNTITVGDGCVGVGVGEKEKIPFLHISENSCSSSELVN